MIRYIDASNNIRSDISRYSYNTTVDKSNNDQHATKTWISWSIRQRPPKTVLCGCALLSPQQWQRWWSHLLALRPVPQRQLHCSSEHSQRKRRSSDAIAPSSRADHDRRFQMPPSAGCDQATSDKPANDVASSHLRRRANATAASVRITTCKNSICKNYIEPLASRMLANAKRRSHSKHFKTHISRRAFVNWKTNTWILMINIKQ